MGYSISRPKGVIDPGFYVYLNDTVFLGEYPTLQLAKDRVRVHAAMTGRINTYTLDVED